MAAITQQELIDAAADALALEAIVNGASDAPNVITRLGRSIPPIAAVLAAAVNASAAAEVAIAGAVSSTNITKTAAISSINAGAEAVSTLSASALNDIQNDVDTVQTQVIEATDEAAAYAVDYITTGGANNVAYFPTRAVAVAANIPAPHTYVLVFGYSTIGDSPKATWKRALAEPVHGAKFQSADGAWWELAENSPDPRMLGAKGDDLTDDTAAFTAVRDYAGSTKVISVSPGVYRIGGILLNVANQEWVFARGATLKLKNAGNLTLIDVLAGGVTLNGVNLDGNKLNQTSATPSLRINRVHGVRINGAVIRNSKREGVEGINCDDLLLSQVKVYDTDKQGIAVYIDTATRAADIIGLRMLDCEVDRVAIGPSASSPFSAIKLTGGGDNTTPYYIYKAVISRTITKLPQNPANSSTHGLEIVRGYMCQITDIQTQGGRMGLSFPRSYGMRVKGAILIGWITYGNEWPSAQNCLLDDFFIDGLNDASVSNGGRGIVTNLISETDSSTNIYPHNNTIGSGTIRRCQRGIHAGGGDFSLLKPVRGLTIGKGCKIIEFGMNATGIYLAYQEDWTVEASIDGMRTDTATVINNAYLLENCSKGAIGGLMRNVLQPLNITVNQAYTCDDIRVSASIFGYTNTHAITLSNGGALGNNISLIACPGLKRAGFKCNIIDLKGNIVEVWGVGSPEAVVIGAISSTYHDTTSATGTKWEKASGIASVATGWKQNLRAA